MKSLITRLKWLAGVAACTLATAACATGGAPGQSQLVADASAVQVQAMQATGGQTIARIKKTDPSINRRPSHDCVGPQNLCDLYYGGN